MAYGRLDVFWPDGLLRTYLLTEPSISVGRSAGNTIALDTDTISRYHLSISQKEDVVYITDLDSANGTYVDGVKLTVNEAHQLYGGEEIMMGELRLIYHDLDENPTRPILVPEEATRRIELEEGDFRLDLEGPEIPISPGAHTSAEVTITNTGDKPERYTVDVSGVPREWVRIDRPDLEIAPQKSGDVMISFKPLRRSDSKPGDYPVHVTVRPKGGPNHALRATVVLHVLPYSGFGMALETPHLAAGDRFRLHLHNQGSDTLPLTLMSRDLTGGLRFNLAGTQLALAPGQRLLVQGQVLTRQRPLFGSAREYPFDLVVRSDDASGFVVSERGYVTEKALLPSWAMYALGGIVLALIAVIIVGILVLLQPTPPPTITALTVSSTRVAQGDPLSVSWSVANASAVVILLNGTPVATAEPGASSAQVDTSGYSGAVTVGVSAISASGEVSATEQVEVYAPLRISYFNVEPTPLVRYVVQSVTLNWSVPDAQTTQLVGVETFSTTPVESVYGPTGSVSVVGLLTADQTTVTLLAQDDHGQTLQESLTLTTVDPQCSAQSDVSVRNGPTVQHQVVGTVPSGQIVVVDARDEGSAWLRVQLAGGAHGWGERSSFTCANTFNPEDLQVDLNFPPPPPTSTPTPTPVATATRTSTARATPTPTVFVQIFVQPLVTPLATATESGALPKSDSLPG
jgi:hypothetical protein